MFDVIVIGKGLTGMLSAIWAKAAGNSVAVVHQGSGRIVQSTGLMDILPGTDGNIDELIQAYQLASLGKDVIQEAVSEFTRLLERLGYPYSGDIYSPVEVITGSGHLKWTGLYPGTVVPIPQEGSAVIISFSELGDFQASYVQGNLQSEREKLQIAAVNIPLGRRSARTMTQLDVARLIENSEFRNSLIQKIKKQMSARSLAKPNFFVFPAVLGVGNWRVVVKDLEDQLGSPVIEAVGMPPNATAIRLSEALEKELIRVGVRIYSDVLVNGCEVVNNQIKEIRMISGKQQRTLAAANYLIATGGILGGGLEVTLQGLRENVLGLSINSDGQYLESFENLLTVGASQGKQVTRYGITGGIYSIISSFCAVKSLDSFKGALYAHPDPSPAQKLAHEVLESEPRRGD